MINRILHSWSFHMKFMKLAEGSFQKVHIKMTNRVRSCISTDSSCSCGNDNEDASHNFFECENFNNLRISMFHKTRPLHLLSLNMIL